LGPLKLAQPCALPKKTPPPEADNDFRRRERQSQSTQKLKGNAAKIFPADLTAGHMKLQIIDIFMNAARPHAVFTTKPLGEGFSRSINACANSWASSSGRKLAAKGHLLASLARAFCSQNGLDLAKAD
jgi:hypothetical protein